MGSDQPQDRTPLYVRIPRAEAQKLDRAAFELKASKQDLIADLISRHVPGFTRRETTIEFDEGLTVGRASFRPNEPREVMTLAEVADWLQVDQETIEALAESGKLPGRKLGDQWRFARQAILAWLAKE